MDEMWISFDWLWITLRLMWISVCGVFWVFLGVKAEVKAEVRLVFFSIKAANKESEGGRLGNFGKCGRLLA